MKNKPKHKTTKAVWKATKPTWRDHLGSLSERLVAGSWKLRWKVWRKSRRRETA